MLKRTATALTATLLLTVVAAAAAAEGRLLDLMPESTVLAVEIDPAGFGSTALAHLFHDLEIVEAVKSVDSLTALFKDAHRRGAMHGASTRRSEGAREHRKRGAHRSNQNTLGAERCEPLRRSVLELKRGGWSGAAALSVPAGRLEPEALLLLRFGSRADSAQLLAGAVACFDGRRYAQQDDVSIYSFRVTNDQSLFLAARGRLLIAANAPDLARSALRLAGGSTEASFASGLKVPIGEGGLSPTVNGLPVGVALTVSTAPLLRSLSLTRSLLPPETRGLYDRLTTTLRAVSNYSLTLGIDELGATFKAVMVVDEELLTAAGESDLLALISCSDCSLADAPHAPRGAVAHYARALPLKAAEAWLDSWLAELVNVGVLTPGAGSVRGAAALYAGVDVGALLLDWHEGAYFTTVLGARTTDLAYWAKGAPILTVLPVTSEAAAKSAVQAWLELANRGANALPGTVGRKPSGAASQPFYFGEAVAVEELEHGGVEYLRLRFGPTTDVGVAVYDSTLVIASPTSVLLDAINVRNQPTAAVGNLNGALTTMRELEPHAYAAVDLGAMLMGASELAEIASQPAATGLWAAVQAQATRERAPRLKSAPGQRPRLTFAQALALTDAFAGSLKQLADRTGVMTKTSTYQDGARTTTWTLPLTP